MCNQRNKLTLGAFGGGFAGPEEDEPPCASIPKTDMAEGSLGLGGARGLDLPGRKPPLPLGPVGIYASYIGKPGISHNQLLVVMYVPFWRVVTLQGCQEGAFDPMNG